MRPILTRCHFVGYTARYQIHRCCVVVEEHGLLFLCAHPVCLGQLDSFSPAASLTDNLTPLLSLFPLRFSSQIFCATRWQSRLLSPRSFLRRLSYTVCFRTRCDSTSGVYPARAAEPPRRCVRPLPRCPRQDLQHREDGVPQVSKNH